MPRILFDEAHAELLGALSNQADVDTDTWQILRAALEDLGWQVATHVSPSLSREALAECDLLVLGSPMSPLTTDEIDALSDWAEDGGAVLITVGGDVSWSPASAESLNGLLRLYGLKFGCSLHRPPQEVTTFIPHYITSGVTQVHIGEPTHFELVDSTASSLAVLPWPEEAFIVANEGHAGRLVAVGDFALFGDQLIGEADNRRLALNIFHWLLRQHALDCRDVRFPDEVYLGQSASFSAVLINPSESRLERARCLLESDAGATIEDSLLKIRSLAAGAQTWLQWSVAPQRLGPQSLRLTVDLASRASSRALFFDPVVRFVCRPSARIYLNFLNEKGALTDTIPTGVAFRIQAIAEWTAGAQQIPLDWRLEYDRSHLTEDPACIQVGTWTLTGLDPGEWPIVLHVEGTAIRVERMLRVRPSQEAQVQDIERRVVAPLDAHIQVLVSQLRPELGDPAVRAIPFHLYGPERYAELVYGPQGTEDALARLAVARGTAGMNLPLVRWLLRSIAPMYSPIHGCCIPYDPDLASDLAATFGEYKENLAHNLLSLRDRDRFWLEQNIAAYLLHEKYGHGFFYKHTALGRQLSLIYRHGLLRTSDHGVLSTPYPKILGPEYKAAFEALAASAIIVNEGFAAWLELTILPLLPGPIGQAAYRRRDFLMNRDDELIDLRKRSAYFGQFPPFQDSRYQEGHDYFDWIQDQFGPDCGPKCAVQAMIIAADVNVGIGESNDQIMLGLQADKLEWLLLKAPSDDARADMRLRRIYGALNGNQETIRAEQHRLQCHRSCLHSECPVNRIITRQLGW